MTTLMEEEEVTSEEVTSEDRWIGYLDSVIAEDSQLNKPGQNFEKLADGLFLSYKNTKGVRNFYIYIYIYTKIIIDEMYAVLRQKASQQFHGFPTCALS
jgi:hypothetical protein